MKWLRCIFGALLVAGSQLPLAAQAPTGTIRGTVTDAESKQGLQGVLIDFGGRRTLTLTDGRFTLTVPAGTDTLRIGRLVSRFTDFELIITDNQSTDGSVAIARGYARQDSRIRVEVNERNLGQFGNRNRAASLAPGRYLKYDDSDDLMYPHCLR